MKQERQSLRLGLAVIACAAVLRVLGAGPLQAVTEFFSRKEVAAALIFLETGRVVRTGTVTATVPEATEPTQPQQPQPPQQAQLSFQPEDAALVQVSAVCDYPLELEQLITAPLSWDLTQDVPTVLILHTHATEAYTQTAAQSYQESSAYRTLDDQHNTVRIGAYLAELLRAGGVRVIHDTQLHDHPDYSGSYSYARKSIQQYLKENPSICMVIDIHRDALDLSSSDQLTTHATVEGMDSAQLMMVVGTDAGGNLHPNWQENMALAVKLHAQLEKMYPGICRPISFRTQRFNQDLSAGGMLIEVGAAGNTLEEALLATRVLAEGILSLASGVTADSTS